MQFIYIDSTIEKNYIDNIINPSWELWYFFPPVTIGELIFILLNPAYRTLLNILGYLVGKDLQVNPFFHSSVLFDSILSEVTVLLTWLDESNYF